MPRTSQRHSDQRHSAEATGVTSPLLATPHSEDWKLEIKSWLRQHVPSSRKSLAFSREAWTIEPAIGVWYDYRHDIPADSDKVKALRPLLISTVEAGDRSFAQMISHVAHNELTLRARHALRHTQSKQSLPLAEFSSGRLSQMLEYTLRTELLSQHPRKEELCRAARGAAEQQPTELSEWLGDILATPISQAREALEQRAWRGKTSPEPSAITASLATGDRPLSELSELTSLANTEALPVSSQSRPYAWSTIELLNFTTRSNQ